MTAEPGPAPLASAAAPFAAPALAVRLAEALRAKILEGELPEGEKVREVALTQEFGVSRTPLREAMKMLAAEGLIELIPNRGAIVSRQSEAELAEAFPVLAALERLAGEFAARNATEEDIARIEEMTEQLRGTVEAGDRHAYFQLNYAIHSFILTAGRNQTLMRTHSTVATRIYRARYQANLSKARWQTALDEHREIARALRARDAARLGALLHDHLMATLASVIAGRSPG
ncbi:GntR family transcriptional regulator [Roseivivax sp. CAU 1761]